jgi:hypothetical protein
MVRPWQKIPAAKGCRRVACLENSTCRAKSAQGWSCRRRLLLDLLTFIDFHRFILKSKAKGQNLQNLQAFPIQTKCLWIISGWHWKN